MNALCTSRRFGIVGRRSAERPHEMGLLTAAASLSWGSRPFKLAGAAVKAAHKGELADLFDLAGLNG